MIYVFRDNAVIDDYFKVTADSKEEAILKIIKNMLKKEAITMDTLCSNLDIEFVDIEELKEYE